MITGEQINTLKYLIIIARNGNDLSKRILIFLINQSEALTKEVCLTLVENREGYTADEIREAAVGIDAMKGSSYTTHLNELIRLTGSEFRFDLHYGDFDPNRPGDPFNNDGQFAGCSLDKVSRPGLASVGMPIRFTFWFAKGFYSRQAALVVATRELLERIGLNTHGLLY